MVLALLSSAQAAEHHVLQVLASLVWEQLPNKCLPPHHNLIIGSIYVLEKAVGVWGKPSFCLPHLAAVLLHAASFLVHGVHVYIIYTAHECFTCRYCVITLIITAQLLQTLLSDQCTLVAYIALNASFLLTPRVKLCRTL
jgi:hypothetical protein